MELSNTLIRYALTSPEAKNEHLEYVRDEEGNLLYILQKRGVSHVPTPIAIFAWGYPTFTDIKNKIYVNYIRVYKPYTENEEGKLYEAYDDVTRLYR